MDNSWPFFTSTSSFNVKNIAAATLSMAIPMNIRIFAV